MTTDIAHEVFWTIHRDLPREGPGCDAATLQAFALLPDLPAVPAILDIGCGPGAQTIALARAGQAVITAVDTHQPFLDDLARRAAQAGVAARIRPVIQPMQHKLMRFLLGRVPGGRCRPRNPA